MRDERGRKVDEGQVVPRFDFPADQQRAEAIVPAVGALDDPAPWLAVHLAEQRRLALLPDVRDDAAMAHGGVAVAKGIAFVEATVVGTPDATAVLEHHRIERGRQGPFVVQIGAA